MDSESEYESEEGCTRWVGGFRAGDDGVCRAVNSGVREVFLATQITTCFLYEAPLASDSTPAASNPSTEGILTKLPSDK